MLNILVISNSLIPSVLLCGHAQLTYLRKQGKVDYKFLPAGKINAEDLSWSDVIVFVRSESYLEEYASELCKGKKHLVYIMDDDLLDLPKYVSCAKYYNVPGIRNNIKTIMNNCDTFLTPSRVLLEKYGKQFKYADLIDEPSLGSKKNKEANEKVKIGFAGSIDRTQDVNKILTESLVEIINKYKDKVEIEFMGAKPDIVNEYHLKYIPYQKGYKRYTEIIGEANWDIGLAPMPITDFHSCKYFNKYVEYASYGIVGIYTNCKPYIYGIKNGHNGLLVNNTTKEWVEAISTLIEGTKLRKKISNNVLKEASNIYSLENLSKQYFERITANMVINNRETIIMSNKKKVKIFFKKVLDRMMMQKWKFPFLCVWYVILKILEALGLKEKNNYNQWEIE